MDDQAPAWDVPSTERKWLISRNPTSGLMVSTEALIVAPQKQALSVTSSTPASHSCRLCKSPPETANHIVAGYKMQAGTMYIERHSQEPYVEEVPKACCETSPNVVVTPTLQEWFNNR